MDEVHAGFGFNVEWLRKYRLKIAIGIAIAIDCGIEGGRLDSDSDPDPDPEHDRERFSTLIRVEPVFFADCPLVLRIK